MMEHKRESLKPGPRDFYAFVRPHPEGVTVSVHVLPNARRTEVVGVQQGALKIRLCAPPVEGAANRECVRFLAHLTGTGKNRVHVLYGDKSRKKVILIRGTTVERLMAIFQSLGYGEERHSPTSNGS